jgi:cyclohexa-1,5-dienecarbonyl-CoA hydratase
MEMAGRAMGRARLPFFVLGPKDHPKARRATNMTYQHIETTFQDGLATLTLNRPPVNVLNIAMMGEINSALEGFHGLKDLKLLLFNAKGKCFSAGVDVGEHMGDLAPKMIETFHRIFRLMAKVPVPTAASVFSSCLGGGCEIAAFCDLVIASEGAKFGQPEIQVGVFPPIAALILPRTIGRKAAMEFILSGKIISATEAKEIGMINTVVPDNDLESETSQFIKPYLKVSAEVLRLAKKAALVGLSDDPEPPLARIEDVYLNQLMKTADANEGLNAFLEKRKPVWKNE